MESQKYVPWLSDAMLLGQALLLAMQSRSSEVPVHSGVRMVQELWQEGLRQQMQSPVLVRRRRWVDRSIDPAQ